MLYAQIIRVVAKMLAVFCFCFSFLVLSFVLSTLNTFFGETQLVKLKNIKGHSLYVYIY